MTTETHGEQIKESQEDVVIVTDYIICVIVMNCKSRT